MAPKPLFLLIGFLFIPTSAFAYSDAELTQMYRGNTDNDTMNNIANAISSGKLQCSDLPNNIIIVQCPDSAQKIQQEDNKISQILHPENNDTSTNSNTNVLSSIVPVMLALVIIAIALVIAVNVVGGGGIGLPRSTHKIKIKGKIEPSKNQPTIYEMNTKNRGAYDGTMPKGWQHQESSKETEPTIEIHLGHKILLMLGMLKVKKNE